MYLYIKNPFKSKYQLLINGREKVGIKELKNLEVFIGCSETIDGIYQNLEDYSPTKKRKKLILFDDVISDMEANKKLSPIVTETKYSTFHSFLYHNLISKCLKL